jgi:Sad1 / UNC-like C-terminal
VRASADIKNPSHVIKKSRDEYLLTECDKQIWFVVELCETIKILRLETDNYELYSGGPKHLSISVADKYSSDRRDWLHLGNFTTTGRKREVESFHNFSAGVFARFVWVEVLAHYDEEHYCTMSSFRVYGISEYEYLLEEDRDHQPRDSQAISLETVDAVAHIQGKLKEVSLFEKKEKVVKVSETIK